MSKKFSLFLLSLFMAIGILLPRTGLSVNANGMKRGSPNGDFIEPSVDNVCCGGIKYKMINDNGIRTAKVVGFDIDSIDFNVSIPDSISDKNGEVYLVTIIGDSAFYRCDKLQEISFPAGLEVIEKYAFYECYYLNYVEVQSGVTSIGDYAFCRCNLEDVFEIPNSVTVIGEGAFKECKNLSSISIPSSVINIGKYAFAGCAYLEEIVVDDLNLNYSSVDGVLFNKDKTELIQCPGFYFGDKFGQKPYRIPKNIKIIGEYAFYLCGELCSIEIPEGTEIISGNAFRDCYRLISIKIPETLESIGEDAFYGCCNLKEING